MAAGYVRLTALRRTGVAVAAICGLLASGIVAATYSAMVDGRERRLDAAISDSQNIASLIRANFERVIESIDLQIDDFLRAYGAGRSEEEIQDFFRTRRYPASVVQVAVADAGGTMVASNLRYPVEKISLADREHFRVHADGKVTGTFISKPVRGRISNIWTLNITRALTDAEGRFAGMAVFAYDLADFTGFYDSLDVGRRGVVSMTGLDGVVRVRSGSTQYFGTDVSRSATFQRMLRERQGVYASGSAVDGTMRIGYFVTSERIPFIFLVAYDRGGVLADRERGETLMWIGCALLVLLVVAAAVGVFREIDQRERRRKADLERALEQRNGALLDAVKSIPGLIVAVASAGGHIMSSNVARENEAPDPELLARLEALIRRLSSDDRKPFPLHEVDRFASAAGGEREVIWAAAEIAAPPGQPPGARAGNAERFIVLGLDNTEQRRQENKIIHMSKLATLGEVATGMAHELNQPLNVIRMAAENALGRGGADGDSVTYVRSKLQRIVAQIDRAAKIIDHMRIFGRKGDSAAAASHDPWAAVEGALNILGEQMRVAGIAVSARGVAGGCRVGCDQALVEQVILNLLLNARDAIEGRRGKPPSDDYSGRVEVSLEVGLGRDATPRARLSVSDNGGGVPKDVLPRLFEPFFTTKPVGKGTGLGLSVSYGIIRELGGELSVGNIGDGARFVIELPCVPARAPAEAMTAS